MMAWLKAIALLLPLIIDFVKWVVSLFQKKK